MLSRKIDILLALTILGLATLACNALSPRPTPSPAPTQTIEPVLTQSRDDPPSTEAEVPRVTVEEAKAALDSGAAIIVDVRGAGAYEMGHIPGAIYVPLGEIETNPTGMDLDKDQWIITYCAWLNEHTSARAAFILLQNGYSHVTPILGGFDAWVDAGYPIEWPMIRSIDHVQIAMPPGGEEKARLFYIHALGFAEIPKPPELAKRGGVWFKSKDVQIHLGVEQDFRPARKAHPALIVEDLDALLMRVQAAGYEIDNSQPPLEGYERAHIFDPFGNRIELMEKRI